MEESIFDITDLYKIVKLLKENNNKSLLDELRKNLLNDRDLYSINMIIEIFVFDNYDYFVKIGYIEEL